MQSTVGRLKSLGAEPATGHAYLRLDSGDGLRVHAVKRGGMGMVYLCSRIEEEETASPKLALKTFDDSFFFDPQMQTAFETEAQTWLMVSGAPYVLPLVSVVLCEKKPHLLMPAVEPSEDGDVSLADEIRRNPHGLPVDRCFSVAMQLVTGLAECIRRVPELIHGDIKPDNVLLFGGGVPHLADFGAARLASRAQQSHVVQGTASYLAPECWSDSSVQSQAVDTYAFGVTLFEMLTGRPPFQAKDDKVEELGRMHREEAVRFPARAADDSLERALQDLALDCLEKDPDDRPVSAVELLARILDVGQEHDPVTAIHHMALLAQSRQIPEDSEMVSMKVESLVRQGDGETAVRILRQLPDKQIVGRLLKLHGTACSLANDDEEALQFFERYLAWEKDEKERIGCMNEKGLSLKRLKRTQEAREVFETALASAPPEAQLMLRGNYAATLMELGEIDRAARILRQLSIHNAESPETWALLSDALWREGSHVTEAISSIQKAVQLSPRNGPYRIMLAKYLMEGPGDIAGAIEALDVAYGLGHHTREWVERIIACYMLLDDRERVAELLSMLKEELSEEKAMAALQAALELAKRLVDDHQGVPGNKENRTGVPEEISESSGPESAETTSSATSRPSAKAHSEYAEADTAHDPGQYRANIRAGTQPHLQMRLSAVDGSTLFDFYYGPEQPDYVDQFTAGMAQLRVGMMGLVDGQVRVKAYAFAQCPACGVVILTQRDEGERYSCQGCERRVAVTFIRTPALDELLNQATARTNQKPRPAAEGTLFVAIAPRNDAQARNAQSRFTDAGYTLVEAGRMVYDMFTMEAHKSGVPFPEAFQVWMRESDGTNTTSEDGTPYALDRLLRELRRETGETRSMSMTAPNAESHAFMLNTAEETFEAARAHAAANPNDTALQRAVIGNALRLGRLADAKKLLTSLRLLFPEDFDMLAASASVALAEGHNEAAIEMLEKVRAARPRDQAARASLLKAYQTAGRPERAEAILRELQAHGVSVRRPANGPAEEL